LVPRRVEMADATAEIGTRSVEGLDTGRILGDTIVDGVNGLDEFLE
jgi:hypothetical protein